MREYKLLELIQVMMLSLMLNQAIGEETSTTTNGNVTVTINSFGACSDDDIDAQMEDINTRLTALETTMDELATTANTIKDCSDIYYTQDQYSSGVFQLYLNDSQPFSVYCLFDSDGLWTVLQQRFDDLTDFNRAWSEYRNGFGILGPNSDYWLGLERMHAITHQRQYTLRMDITDWDGSMRYAEYSVFHIGDEASKYPIFYTGYTGTAGDAMGIYHMMMKFSTLDSDNDMSPDHCAAKHMGGWWYRDCDHGNLNGQYMNSPTISTTIDSGIEWDTWRAKYSFRTTRMRIKPTFNDQLD